MSSTLGVDIAAFVGLFIVSTLVRSRFHHHGYSATAAGGIVMAIGIFADFSLRQLPFDWPLLERLVTLELLVIWLFLARSYVASALNRHFRMHLAHPLRRFAIGTWVAGTAVLSALGMHALPEAPLFGKVLALVAVAIYLPYVALFVAGYARLLRRPFRQNANGIILLATVSTQAVVIALHDAFGSAFPGWYELGMLAFDICFLCAGLVLVVLHYGIKHNYVLAIEWKNANCILHGAVSITGLALVLTGDFSPYLLLDLWLVVLIIFVLVESVEIARMIERERARGLRLGIFVYDVTQWTRNFTYGMFYAFSFALLRYLDTAPPTESVVWLPAVRALADWGQYVVLAFLLIEIAIFFRARLHHFRRAPQPARTTYT
ncbi:MAG: hypothetical protein ACRESR_01040 [Gammaproteobacteria bacterium]